MRPTIIELLQRHPRAEVVVATWSPEYDQARFPHASVRYVKDHYLTDGQWCKRAPDRASRARRVWRRAAALVGGRGPTRAQGIGSRRRREEMPFEDVDLVVVSGGDLYSSDYGTNSLRHFVEPVLWAKSRGVPCALIGQSVGRFRKEEDVELWRQAEQAASLITLREPLSQQYLVNDLRSLEGRFAVSADTAFLLEPDAAIGRPVASAEGRPMVALALSQSICQWTGNDFSRHIEVWVQLIRTMIDLWKADVALIPHVQEGFGDDRIICTEVWRRLDFDRRVRVYGEDLGASEFKGIIARCQLVVAERMHAAIAGLSSGVCTAPIGYSIKAQGIMTSVLEGSGLDPENLVLPIGEVLDLPVAIRKLQRIWDCRLEYQQAIAASLDRSKAAAKRNFDMVDALLK